MPHSTSYCQARHHSPHPATTRSAPVGFTPTVLPHYVPLVRPAPHHAAQHTIYSAYLAPPHLPLPSTRFRQPSPSTQAVFRVCGRVLKERSSSTRSGLYGGGSKGAGWRPHLQRVWGTEFPRNLRTLIKLTPNRGPRKHPRGLGTEFPRNLRTLITLAPNRGPGTNPATDF